MAPFSTEDALLSACNAFFTDFATNATSRTLLSHFSTTNLVTIQHAPAACPRPYRSRFEGLTALRSYLDLLSTHWTRSNTRVHSTDVDAPSRRVVVSASVTWTWKKSRRSFQEDFTCTMDFDEHEKITTFVVCTVSGAATCVMRSVDADVNLDPVLRNNQAMAQV